VCLALSLDPLSPAFATIHTSKIPCSHASLIRMHSLRVIWYRIATEMVIREQDRRLRRQISSRALRSYQDISICGRWKRCGNTCVYDFILGAGGTLGRPYLLHRASRCHTRKGSSTTIFTWHVRPFPFRPITTLYCQLASSVRASLQLGRIAFFAFSKHGARQALCLSLHAFGSSPESECLERSCHFLEGLGGLLAERRE
jgi:hypothetical protein